MSKDSKTRKEPSKDWLWCEDWTCPACGGTVFQPTWRDSQGRLIHSGVECEDCDWNENKEPTPSK